MQLSLKWAISRQNRTVGGKHIFLPEHLRCARLAEQAAALCPPASDNASLLLVLKLGKASRSAHSKHELPN